MDIREILECFMLIFSPFIEAIEYFFTSFVRDDLIIFGLPYYQWVLGLFILTILFRLFMGVLDD